MEEVGRDFEIEKVGVCCVCVCVCLCACACACACVCVCVCACVDRSIMCVCVYCIDPIQQQGLKLTLKKSFHGPSLKSKGTLRPTNM